MPEIRQQSLQILQESSPEPSGQMSHVLPATDFLTVLFARFVFKELKFVPSSWGFRFCYSANGQTSFQIRIWKIQGLDSCILRIR